MLRCEGQFSSSCHRKIMERVRVESYRRRRRGGLASKGPTRPLKMGTTCSIWPLSSCGRASWTSRRSRWLQPGRHRHGRLTGQAVKLHGRDPDGTVLFFSRAPGSARARERISFSKNACVCMYLRADQRRGGGRRQRQRRTLCATARITPGRVWRPHRRRRSTVPTSRIAMGAVARRFTAPRAWGRWHRCRRRFSSSRSNRSSSNRSCSFSTVAVAAMQLRQWQQQQQQQPQQQQQQLQLFLG